MRVPGKSAGFLGYAFLHTAVSREDDDVLVENGVLGGVKPGGGHLGRHCVADGVGNALAKRPGGRFHPRGFKGFGMAGSFAVQHAEIGDFLNGKVITSKVQPRIKEHGAMPGRKHKPVAVEPLGLFGVQAQEKYDEYFASVA